MLALGFTDQTYDLPSPLIVDDCNGLYIVAVAQDAAPTGRDRMNCLVQSTRFLNTILPISPSTTIHLELARDWALKDSAELTISLKRLAHKVQLSLLLWLAEEAVYGNKEWLRSRAKKLQTGRDIANTLESALLLNVRNLSQNDLNWEVLQSTMVLNILVDSADAENCREIIKGLCSIDQQMISEACLTGPWPPLAFANEGKFS